MTQLPYSLDAVERRIVLEAIKEVCEYRKWILMAAHVRSTHVHVVVTAPCKPEKVMKDFKAYATRALRQNGHVRCNRKVWSRHGSTRYKWTDKDVASAIDYVILEQGEAMELFP